MHTRASNSELVEPLPEPERTLNRRLLRRNKRVPFEQRNKPPTQPRIVYPPIFDISYFRHFCVILENYNPMDDELMWAADRVVAPTPGSAITNPETTNEFAIKVNHLTLVKRNQFDADLDASINLMPYSVYAKLSLKTLKPTKMSVRLADRSFQHPIGIAENMLVKVGKFTFLVDFVILEMEEDSKVSLILGIPFLYITDAVIKVKHKQLNHGVCTKQMTLLINSAMKHSCSKDDTCFSIDVVDENSESESDIKELPIEKITFNTDHKIKTSLEEPLLNLELKPLPDNLEYVFMEEPSFIHVIISSQLSEQNKNKLISVLKRHKQAFAWKTTDILRICPSFCKYKIQVLEDKKPVVQKQRRLNLNMQKVVKKEISKLLDIGIIYLIANSPWASLMHCVPKKGGITVVTNEKDELVPTRTVMGWRVVAAAKLPILYPNEFDLWKMRIEQYFLMTDYSLLEVILNEQRLGKKNKLKARGTLLMALRDKHQLKFNIHKDAKSLMEAIEKRFGGNTETKKVQKTLLKQQYENFSGQSSESLDQIHDRLQKLISQLEIFGESLSQKDINMKFLRSLPSNDAVIYSFFACQLNSPQLDNEDLKQIDADDLEEMNLKWQMAMLTMRARRFLYRTGRNLDANGTSAIGFDMSKVECYNCHRRGHFARECMSPRDTSFQADEEPTNYALMAFTSSSLSSSLGSDNEAALCSKACLESVEARLVIYQQNENVFEEDIKLLKLDVMLRDNALVELRKRFEKAKKERDELKHTLEKFQTSSKNLSKPLESQIIDQTGLRYDNQVFNSTVFDCVELNSSESDESVPTSLVHDRYKSGEGYHVVPPPYTGTFMPLKPDLVFYDAPTTSETFLNVFKVEPSTTKPTKDMTYVKPADHPKQAENLRTDNPKSRGHKHRWNRKACFVCKSLNHLIKDYDYYEKQMVQKPVWNYAMRTLSYLFDVHGNPQEALQDKGVIDSGCSRHMTENISYLSDFEEINKGYVAFGGNPKGGKITGKGFQKENNMYNVDLKNVVSSGDLTCLFAKATLDESNLWHRRLGHINFKTLNKLVKGILVRGLPSKVFKNNHTCVACKKGKQHRASYPLGKFDGKVDEGFLVGYSVNSKAFRVFNSRTRIVQETLHINFLENQPNVAGSGPKWLFDIDTLTQSMNYQLVVARNQPNHSAGIKEKLDAGKVGRENQSAQQYMLLPIWSTGSKDPQNTDADATFDVKENESKVHVSRSSSDKLKKHDEKVKKKAKGKSLVDLSTEVRDLRDKFEEFSVNSTKRVNAASAPITAVRPNPTNSTNSFNAASPSDNAVSLNFEIGGKSSFMDPSQYPDDPDMPALEDTTRSMARMVKEQGGLNQINNKDFHTCMFACFLSQEEPKKVHQAFKDPSWIEAIQEELLQFKMQKVQVLVDLPNGKRAIGSKWVFRNKKDERGTVIRNKARLVAQGHTQEEGIDYEEVFAPVVRIEAIRLFLAYASFMGFMVYQMDVKSAFIYGTIEEEVYVCQPPGFEEPDYPDKIYVDDIIFRSTNKELCKAFEKLMKDKFQMSSMGELTFFLGLQTVVATSSTEAKYVAAASCCAQVLWIQNQLLDYGKKVVVTEDTIWQDLRLNDADGVECLPNEEIFTELARMGYEKPPPKLTFYKAMVRNVDSPFKFLMYLWFLQVMINAQVDDLSFHNTKYTSPALTQKVFANMRRIGKGFSRVETPLFATMLVQPQAAAEEEDDDDDVSAAPTPPLPTPATTPTSPIHKPLPPPPEPTSPPP
nr:reverse transcriptase domain-containing protein [Tanacetum cinerariifolium]